MTGSDVGIAGVGTGVVDSIAN
ncbi:MAG: hypothetical protein QOG34_1551, partial [Frankiaceae bacterium]|nr:hypothetical protein [Frankiaceae bacterium]